MKIKNLILLSFVAILFTACGTSSDPVKIAEEFAKAFVNADYDKCNKMMEDEEFTPSDEMSSMEKAVIKAMQEEAKKMKYIFTVDKEYTDMSEEDADIRFNVTSAKDSDFKKTIRVSLEKDDYNKWRVTHYRSFK